MAQITYANKSDINTTATPATNKVTSADMNEIKSVVNTNANLMGDLANLNTTDKSNLVGAINEINTVTTGSATVNSTYISSFESNTWERIGKVVVYHFTLTVTGTWDNTTNFLTNLPKPISYIRFVALNSSTNEPIRVAIDTNGGAYNAWSLVAPISGQIIEGSVTYITSE